MMSPAQAAQLDLSGRLSAAMAVVDAIDAQVPCGDAYRLAAYNWDTVLNLTAAARDVLLLAKGNCETLEGAE